MPSHDMSDQILHVCVTCGHPDDPRPGKVLYDRIAALMSQDEPFALKPVTCLSRCGEGCAVAATAPGKWGYLLGRLSPDHAGDLITYARSYAAAPNGTVMASRRAPSLKDVVIGRIPALEPAL